VTTAECNRILGRLEAARQSEDQDGISLWRALYAQDVGPLLAAVEPVDKILESAPSEPEPEKRDPLTVGELETSTLQLIEATEWLKNSDSPGWVGLEKNQLGEALGYFRMALRCLLRITKGEP